MALPAGGYILCPQCGQRKPPVDFSRKRDSDTGRQAWCKDCHAAYDRQRRDTRKVPDGTPARPTAKMNVTFLRGTKDRLREVAAREGKTMSLVVNEAVTAWLDQRAREAHDAR